MLNPSPVLLDKLSFTLDIDESDREGLVSIVRDGLRDHDRLFLPIDTPWRVRGYRSHFMFDLDRALGSRCRVCLDPYNTDNAFARFEFNPSKAGARGFDAIDSMISIMLPDAGNTPAFLYQQIKKGGLKAHRPHPKADILVLHDDLIAWVKGESSAAA